MPWHDSAALVCTSPSFVIVPIEEAVSLAEMFLSPLESRASNYIRTGTCLVLWLPSKHLQKLWGHWLGCPPLCKCMPLKQTMHCVCHTAQPLSRRICNFHVYDETRYGNFIGQERWTKVDQGTCSRKKKIAVSNDRAWVIWIFHFYREMDTGDASM